MRKHLATYLFILLAVQRLWGEVTPGITLTTYYADASGKYGAELRTALSTIISANYKTVSYDNLGYLLKYADTQNADGTTIVDIYSTCSNTTSVSGEKVTWGSQCSGTASENVGCNSVLNREHTVPQSWFNEASPMVSDAFHIYAVDAVSNGHRSDHPFGECSGGTSYKGSTCNESGKLGTCTFSGYGGTVYEPIDEYKGDIARGYFYMITRYRTTNFTQASGSNDDECFTYTNGQVEMTTYMLNLMLKWHRQDPVSEKELIRNEVIYGNTTYHKGNTTNYAQKNRNPFIDYPDLVEYIWGDKKTTAVDINTLTPAYLALSGGTGGVQYINYVTECSATQWTITFEDKMHGTAIASQTVSNGGTFVFPSVEDKEKEAGTCAGEHYHFVGWLPSTHTATPITDADLYTAGTTSEAVTANATYYAVWAKETEQ